MTSLRIGELSRRTGVSPELLRAWERRYGLLRPTRTDGGFRLYSAEDERRIRHMQEHLAQGVAAAEAARLAAEDEPAERSPVEELLRALLRFDDDEASSIFDRALARLTTEGVLQDLVLPVLRAIGDGWERGEVSVAQEHFASNLVRGRLLGLARRWDQGVGPRALLACPPGELHDIPLLVFGIALRARGWRIVFLGADTPLATVREAAASLEPALVVLSASRPQLELDPDEVRSVAGGARLALAGAWPAAAWADRLEGDPVEAARSLSVR
jgi:DNA-binding transcriptional MerR regulator